MTNFTIIVYLVLIILISYKPTKIKLVSTLSPFFIYLTINNYTNINYFASIFILLIIIVIFSNNKFKINLNTNYKMFIVTLVLLTVVLYYLLFYKLEPLQFTKLNFEIDIMFSIIISMLILLALLKNKLKADK